MILGREEHLRKIMGEKKTLSLGRAVHLKMKKLDFGKGRTSEKNRGGEKRLEFGKGWTSEGEKT